MGVLRLQIKQELRTVLQNMLKDKNQSWLSFGVEMIVLVAVVLFIRVYIFQFFRVSGPSMCPTLNQTETECLRGKGEFIFVNQARYQLFGDPKFGEVVVFRPPNKDMYLIKRVIGVPGDTITFEDGLVYRENEDTERMALEEPYLSAENTGSTDTEIEEIIVPEGYYVLLGDNRTQSLDSRRCFGSCGLEGSTALVPNSNIAGRAEVVVWPPARIRDIAHTEDLNPLPPQTLQTENAPTSSDL